MPKFDLSLVPAAPNLCFEQALWDEGLRWVAGIDEAGRGPLAGPVSAAAVIFPADPNLEQALSGVRDSKQMTAPQREYWAEQIQAAALAWSVAFASAKEIDQIGISPATRLAVCRAVERLAYGPQHLLVDYLQLPELALPQTPLVKGDARSLSIAAASILAKTARDWMMCTIDIEYPGYGFARHKGYGTAAHLEALQRLGPCSVHRRSFAPVGNLLRTEDEGIQA